MFISIFGEMGDLIGRGNSCFGRKKRNRVGQWSLERKTELQRKFISLHPSGRAHHAGNLLRFLLTARSTLAMFAAICPLIRLTLRVLINLRLDRC
jgi:hypothetical protein